MLLALIGSWLGVEGWRQAATPFPPLPAMADHSDLAATALQQLGAEQWWRDPELSLDTLARRRGTTSPTSLALQQHGGPLQRAVNGLRAEEVAPPLDAGGRTDLLTIALASGFGSKASFNRGFRTRYGVSPSAYRDGADRKKPPPASD